MVWHSMAWLHIQNLVSTPSWYSGKSTRDQMIRFNMNTPTGCVLCNKRDGLIDHLFSRTPFQVRLSCYAPDWNINITFYESLTKAISSNK